MSVAVLPRIGRLYQSLGVVCRNNDVYSKQERPCGYNTYVTLATIPSGVTCLGRRNEGVVIVMQNGSKSFPEVLLEFERLNSSYSPVLGKTPGDDLDFSNHALVFQHRTSSELLRGLVVLHVCGIDRLVKHSYKIFRVGERVLGSRLLGKCVSPFYWQFVAGDTEEEMSRVAKGLQRVKINLMIAPMIETDVGEGYELGSQYDMNMEKTIHLVEVAGRQGKGKNLPICQTKHTAHLSADVLSRISTTYETLNRQQRIDAVKAVADVMMDETATKENALKIKLADLKLKECDHELFIESLYRFRKIGQRCVDMTVTLAVDAEYTYTNPAISLIALAMMKNFNHERPVVWNTYQGLLQSTPCWLRHDLDIAKCLNMKFGAKIVRGAYLDIERSLAKERCYPDPTNPTYEATSDTYNGLVKFLGEEVSKKPGWYNVMVASHNEASVRKAVNLLENMITKPLEGSFVFGQVYGMAENISVPLAAAGYQVYKSIPYGNMDEVLPYLSRRASENRAVFRGVRQERDLLTKQLLSRISPV